MVGAYNVNIKNIILFSGINVLKIICLSGSRSGNLDLVFIVYVRATRSEYNRVGSRH